MGQIFFGYPSRPESLREALATGCRKVTGTGLGEVVSWESLKPAGQVIIDTITDAIDASDLAAFDVTGMNPNVLFELGYAIGSRKRVWILLNDRSAEARRQWDAVRTLTTIGYSPYVNSDDIRDRFLQEHPHLHESSLFERAIQANLRARGSGRRLLYLRNAVETEADRYLAREVDRREKSREYTLRTVDGEESTVYPLPWYGQQIYESIGVVVHLARSDYRGATTHNARCSLVAGLAHGMGVPTLVLGETGSDDPIDYRDIQRRYERASECVGHFSNWLDELPQAAPPEAHPLADVELRVELSGLRLGEHVAENEADTLDDYFIRTAEYEEVLRRDVAVFVGRKGVGKTANLIRASAELSRDRRNLVCVIKPQGYDLAAVARLMREVGVSREESYVADGMWRYLLLTEIARSAAERIRNKPAPPLADSPEIELLRLVDMPDSPLQEDFSVRLEHAVRRLDELLAQPSSGANPRRIADILHGQIIGELLPTVAAVCSEYDRVALLVDNLDKSWDKSADVEHLVQIILGLLSAIGTVQRSVRRGHSGAADLRVTLAVFLRSDIFHYVVQEAREPDKIPVVELKWSDPTLLLRVIEERFQSIRGSSESLFDKYFVPSIDGRRTPDYLVDHILPRPRDLVHLCNGAIFAAVNRKHSVVDQEDIDEGMSAYSQFALESLRVENGVSQETFEDVIFEFAGMSSILLPGQVSDAIVAAGVTEQEVDSVLFHLVRLSFLGQETKDGLYSYVENPRDVKRIAALSRNLSRDTGRPSRFRIHPAYWPYLEIEKHTEDVLGR